jgi:hypothetical protein
VDKGKWSASRSYRSGRYGDQENVLSLPRIEPQPFNQLPIAIPIKLPSLEAHINNQIEMLPQEDMS